MYQYGVDSLSVLELLLCARSNSQQEIKTRTHRGDIPGIFDRTAMACLASLSASL